jgi:hypothetical protein
MRLNCLKNSMRNSSQNRSLIETCFTTVRSTYCGGTQNGVGPRFVFEGERRRLDERSPVASGRFLYNLGVICYRSPERPASPGAYRAAENR